MSCCPVVRQVSLIQQVGRLTDEQLDFQPNEFDLRKSGTKRDVRRVDRKERLLLHRDYTSRGYLNAKSGWIRL